jgi:hypothetical protein
MWKVVVLLPLCGVAGEVAVSWDKVAGVVIGSRRSATHARALATATIGGPFEFERDAFAFEGPVVGMGFVTHKHDVVFKNTTAWLDDFREAVAYAGCAPLVTAPVHATHFMRPYLPGEASSVQSRVGMQLNLQLSSHADASSPLVEWFLHRLSTAQFLVIGVDTLPLLQHDQCAALVGSAPPVYRIVGFRRPTSGLAADGLSFIRNIRVELQPAGLLEAFASASWRHRVEPDIDTALAARGLSWRDFPHANEATARQLASWTLASLNVNRDGIGSTGSIKDASITLKDWTAARLSCENCSAYFSAVLDAELELCVWGFWNSHGCARDSQVGFSGYRLHFSATVTVEAGVTAGLRLATVRNAEAITIDETIFRSRLLTVAGPTFTFTVFGLIVQVRVQLRRALRSRVSLTVVFRRYLFLVTTSSATEHYGTPHTCLRVSGCDAII